MNDNVESGTTCLPPIRIDSETFLKDHFALPPLPQVVGTILEEIRTGNANATRVADILESDPGLVAQILKIVNSAYYGLSNRISRVSHAVAYLGLAEVERVMLAASVMKSFPITTSSEMREVWIHSFHTAISAKYLAGSHVEAIDCAELHTAVLLHDVGKLVYLTFFPEHYRRMEELARSEGVLLVDAERELEYPSHRELGGMLCVRWNLPETIRGVCERHEPEDLQDLEATDPRRDEIRFVCLVNLLCNLASREFSAQVRTGLREAAREALGIDEAEFSVLLGEVSEMKTEAEGFLQQLSGAS